ncbi:MAG: N-acetylneuraminate synthase family protein [Lachnospiraceae bacterium]|nr:N-acetylneuraminate synthase family protein [Lachnospiraceae bacterium]
MGKSVIKERLKENKFTLVGEIGVNYYDIASKMGLTPLEAACLMIDKAAQAGIHAVKFQSYKAGTLASKDSPAYWDRTEEPTGSQYELFRKFDAFGEKEYRALYEHSEKRGIEFLSTAFDTESADYLNDMMNVYKISSSDLSNLPFIEYQAKKNKPVILSVGASNEDEIRRAVDTIRQYNSEKITLLHCVLEYPTPLDHANLLKIASLKEKFPDCYTGYSDHTKPTPNFDVIKTAFNLGAVLVEKHFTLDKKLKGNDHYHAMDPFDAMKILSGINDIIKLRGKGDLVSLSTESAARQNARRSLVAAVDIHEGTVITEEMLTWKRPGLGISPSEIDTVIGKKAATQIAQDTVLKRDMLA